MTENTTSKIEYVLFDMDGLMIDSEKIYTTATSTKHRSAIDAVLGKFGEEMSWEIKAGCMGKPEREGGIHTLSFFPNIPISLDDFLAERNKIQDTLWSSAKLLPGVHKLVTHLKAHNIPMAVATSSRRRNFVRKSGHLQAVFSLFEGKVICGDDRQYKMCGKPAPDIFLVAAKKLLGREVGEPDEECTAAQMEERAKGLVFEDAFPGMQAGKRAGMKVVWVPDQNVLNFGHSVNEVADSILGSLEDFKPEDWGLPPYPTESEIV